ncbi:MAG TPA: 16S rRNA (uracil(1498)-N(3))-methyltransferase [Candidatus Alistipes merdigallinarum]|nr:16S rRNA (uracil(1498)-N(3))-methyltransferase [Candidatus Alistipes merdigallinarum]
MQLFYAPDIDFGSDSYTLSEEESRHCVRVLRLRIGDSLYVTDGKGTLCRAEIAAISPKNCTLSLRERTEAFEKRGYRLCVAIAPTKNTDRLEWFVEKATEIGIDRIIPLLTEHSERRVLKSDRLMRVATGAVKQSLKAYHPQIDELTPFKEVIKEGAFPGRKFIAYCGDEVERIPLKECIQPGEDVLVLIGPEGDFSPEEVAMACRNGFVPVTLGRSRLRTETAGVVAVHTVALLNDF